MTALPDRVLVYGVTGSGKSTAALALIWHFRSFARKRSRMRAWAADPDLPPVLLFRRPRELEAWLEGINRPFAG